MDDSNISSTDPLACDNFTPFALRNSLGFCVSCWQYTQDCTCSPDAPFPFLPFQQEVPFATLEYNSRHAARPPGEEMESSSGPGASASSTTLLPANPYTSAETSGMTLTQPPANESMDALETTSFLAPPDPTCYVDHFEASHVRQSVDNNDVSALDSDAAAVANILLANGSNLAMPNIVPTEELLEPVHYTHEPLPDAEQEAYAKLTFQDGDLFIRTEDLFLGRNPELYRQLKRQYKQSKRAAKELDEYRKEPSQPSQPGDEDQNGNPSTSSHSLEGRPAPPSNFSEHGGLVWHPEENVEPESHRARLKRRTSGFSKSSSNNSIAPATLHPSMISDPSDPYNEAERPRTEAFIPIHPSDPDHIRKISKQHLAFRYSYQDHRWELHVLGNNVFVNEEVFGRGNVIPLEHGDEIQVLSVNMIFKLPDNCRGSPRQRSGGSEDNALVVDSDSEDEEDEDEAAGSQSPAPKMEAELTPGDSISGDENEVEEKPRRKKQDKARAKSVKMKKTGAGFKKNEKFTKPKSSKQPKKEPKKEPAPKAAKKSTEGKGKGLAKDDEVPEDESGAPFKTVQPVGADTALPDVPPDEVVARRKGPGRPPKDGNLSKRDKGLGKKRQREYWERQERTGEAMPSWDEIIAEVRLESKMKEAAKKAVAQGLPPPDTAVMQSIEKDETATRAAPAAISGEATASTDPPPPKRLSPAKPRRVLSPVKPLEECSEEELARPNKTYAVLIDEILREHPTGIADLQEIYERIMKKHPYYKYKTDSNGWQSSVRHNLQDVNRFISAGRSGKGNLWKIDPDHPLDEKKKNRRQSPPASKARNAQQAQNQAMQQQYANSQYGNPYGQPQHNGQPPIGPQPGSGVYYSPYGQPGQYPQGGPGAPHPNGVPHGPRYPHHDQQPHQQQPAPSNAPSQVATEHQSLVGDLVPWIQQYMAQFAANPAEGARQNALVDLVINYLSEYYASREPSTEMKAKVKTQEHQGIYQALLPIFRKHKPDLRVPVDVWSDDAPLFPSGGPVADGAIAQMSAPEASSVPEQPTAAPQAPAVQGDSNGATLMLSVQTAGAGTKREAEDDDEPGRDAKRSKLEEA